MVAIRGSYLFSCAPAPARTGPEFVSHAREIIAGTRKGRSVLHTGSGGLLQLL